jgi:hypothetical protein
MSFVTIEPRGAEREGSDGAGRMVEVTMHVHGKGSVNNLAATLSEVNEVVAVVADNVNSVDE